MPANVITYRVVYNIPWNPKSMRSMYRLYHKKRDLTDVYGPWENQEPEDGVNCPRAINNI